MRLKVSKQTRAELLSVIRLEYLTAQASAKSEILTQFVATTGYSRKHAIALLNAEPVKPKPRQRKPRALREEAINALILIWNVANRICAKRLVPFIPVMVENLERNNHLVLTEVAREELLTVSAATVDRVLKAERQKHARSISHTKRGALVKNMVPIRTFADWNNVVPGFFEIDTVSHSSSNPNGPFLDTLNMTDIATCWTVTIALQAKTAKEVVRALEDSKNHIPFPILGIDFDNGSEFLNEALIDWSKDHKITYTRSRSYKKNDQAWIEEKNRSVVRRNVGRRRYVTKSAFLALTKLYDTLRVYFNFFQPCQKLLKKTREGAKVSKQYDTAKTPFQRVLDSDHVDAKVKEELRIFRDSLDMLGLHKTLLESREHLRTTAEDLPDPILPLLAIQRMGTHEFLQNTQSASNEVATSPKRKGLAKQIRDLIGSLPTGSLIRAADLDAIGSRLSINACLHRFTKLGLLRSHERGVYQTMQPPERAPRKGIRGLITQVIQSQTIPKPITWRDFQHLAPKLNINAHLHRIAKTGVIQRVKHGIYIRADETLAQKQIRTGTNLYEAMVLAGTISE